MVILAVDLDKIVLDDDDNDLLMKMILIAWRSKCEKRKARKKRYTQKN